MGLLLYDKPFKTINEQIQLLRDKHKLIINNDAFAQSALLNTSYYDHIMILLMAIKNTLCKMIFLSQEFL